MSLDKFRILKYHLEYFFPESLKHQISSYLGVVIAVVVAVVVPKVFIFK